MPRGVPRSAGWISVPNAAAGVEAFGIYTKDPAARVPYVFGLGPPPPLGSTPGGVHPSFTRAARNDS